MVRANSYSKIGFMCAEVECVSPGIGGGFQLLMLNSITDIHFLVLQTVMLT